MNPIEGPYGTIATLNERIVVVRINDGYNLDHELAAKNNRRIAKAMGCDYGMLIDRIHNYSIQPIEVFEVLNEIDNLKAIAVVCYRPETRQIAQMEKRFFHRTLEIFDNVEDAKTWLEETLDSYKDKPEH